MRNTLSTAVCAAALCFGQLHAQTVLPILPGTNNVPITSVTYTVDSADVTQNTEATGVAVNRDNPVTIKSITIDTGSGSQVLSNFNTAGATIPTLNLTSSTGGVAVFKNGNITNTSDLNSFKSALVGMTQDTDILNYLYYDGVSNMPPSSVHDFDILYQRGFLQDDYILVSERFGNTFFEVKPLDAAGNIIPGTNTLRFGGNGGGAYEVYDWNTGYAANSYVNTQAVAFTVASINKFFEGTNTPFQTVYGYRIDNDGEADVKFFGLSSNDFANNPLIPEPTTFALGTLSIGLLALRRRRAS